MCSTISGLQLPPHLHAGEFSPCAAELPPALRERSGVAALRPRGWPDMSSPNSRPPAALRLRAAPIQEGRKLPLFSGSRFPPFPFSSPQGKHHPKARPLPVLPARLPCAPLGSAAPPVRPRSAPFGPSNPYFLSPPSPLPPSRAVRVGLNDPKEGKKRVGAKTRGEPESGWISPSGARGAAKRYPVRCRSCAVLRRLWALPGCLHRAAPRVPLYAVKAAVPALLRVRPAHPGGGRSACGQRPPQRSAGVHRPAPMRCAPCAPLLTTRLPAVPP